MIVRVPASSANLGPGFDSFGIAWQLYNEISFQPSEKTEIFGCGEAYRNEDNLALRAYRRVLERCGVRDGGVALRFGRTSIPVSRGLGSSAALITAGFAFLGVYMSNRKQAALVAYRLEKLEEKVDKHNSVVERMYRLEEQVKNLQAEVKLIHNA